MRTIAQIKTPEEIPKKVRKIIIYKDRVFKDVDKITFRYADGSGTEQPRLHNVVSSDSNERLDRTLMETFAKTRNALLRKRLQKRLASIVDSTASNQPEDGDVYVFNLLLPETIDDNIIQPLADLMHQYFLYGILSDWFSSIGSPQANTYGLQLTVLEDEIVSTAKGPSIVKRPVPPFWPGSNIKW